MVAPQDPRSLARRVRRLEFLFFSLLLSKDDEGDDQELWFEFQRFFRMDRDRDFLDEPRFEFFMDRMFERRRRSQPQSQLQLIEQLQNEIKVLKTKTDMVQIETHSFLAIQALGLPADRVQSIRYVPIRAYIDQTPDGAIDAISAAISDVLSAYGSPSLTNSPK